MNSLYRGISLAAVFWTTVSMSAYTPHETGSRTTASGARAKEGYTCAANFVPMGSVIIYEGHKNKHKENRSKQIKTKTESKKHIPTEETKPTPKQHIPTEETNTASNQQIPTEEIKIHNKADNSSRSHSPAAAPVFKPQVRP